jgi:exonuclease VII large subunit
MPVWVAIGHAGDRHLVDEVAQRSFATPTQAAAELRRRADALTAAARESDLDHRREEAEQRTTEVEGRAATRVRWAIGVAGFAVVVAFVVLILALVRGAG